MKHLPYVALAVLVAVAFFVGRGCRDDEAWKRDLDEARLRVEALEQTADSLRALHASAVRALASARDSVESADAARRDAQRESSRARQALKQKPSYATLSNDDLAARFDSVFSAQSSIRH